MHLLKFSLRRWGKTSPLRARGNCSRRLQLRFSLVRLGRVEREGTWEIWGRGGGGGGGVLMFTTIDFSLLYITSGRHADRQRHTCYEH